MDNLLRVGVLHAAGHRADQLGRLRGRSRLAGEVLSEAATLDELHGEVGSAGVLADLVDLHDVGVPHPRRRFRLDAEAGPLLRAGQGSVADQLQRDQPLQTHLPGLVDDPHAAPAELTEDFVTGDGRPVRRHCLARRRPLAGRREHAHRVSSFPGRCAPHLAQPH